MKPLTYHEVRVREFKKEVKKVDEIVEKQRVQWTKFCCSIVMDKWMAQNGKMIINILVNSLIGSVFLGSVDASNEYTDATKMYNLFEETVEQIGPQNVVQIITDSASKNVKAGGMISVVHSHIYWTPCAAHCINTMFGDIFNIDPYAFVCPLEFKQPLEVINACRNLAAPSPSCCSSLNAYISGMQKQMLITNRQAIICAVAFGFMLQKAGVMTNVYELCDVDLKDFSLQAYGQEGCLLRSYPADLVYDNSTGFSFTCDLNDNIAAPWPSSSRATSLTLCAPEMSLPALPTSKTLGNYSCPRGAVDLLVPILLFFVSILF